MANRNLSGDQFPDAQEMDADEFIHTYLPTDYESWEEAELNVDGRHMGRMRDALLRGEEGPNSPVDVSKFYLEDGHHRVLTNRALGRPVKYRQI